MSMNVGFKHGRFGVNIGADIYGGPYRGYGGGGMADGLTKTDEPYNLASTIVGVGGSIAGIGSCIAGAIIQSPLLELIGFVGIVLSIAAALILSAVARYKRNKEMTDNYHKYNQQYLDILNKQTTPTLNNNVNNQQQNIQQNNQNNLNNNQQSNINNLNNPNNQSQSILNQSNLSLSNLSQGTAINND